jgi:A/G-specific adenine glycosylase
VRKPRCLLCPLRESCEAFAAGDPARLPVKAAKKAKPRRHGTIFWLERREGARAVWLVRRPDRGLLGGMRALPTGPWTDPVPALAEAPAAINWRMLGGKVEHGFTHFDLTLALAVGRGEAQGAGEWWPVADLAAAGLPTLFAKAAQAVMAAEALDEGSMT